MCDHAPNRETAMVVTHRDETGKPIVWCDPCLESIIRALNDAGLPTIASCCGHGVNPGRISLRDGRELLLFPDFDATSSAEGNDPEMVYTEFYANSEIFRPANGGSDERSHATPIGVEVSSREPGKGFTGQPLALHAYDDLKETPMPDSSRNDRCNRRQCRGRLPHSRLVHWFGWVRR